MYGIKCSKFQHINSVLKQTAASLADKVTEATHMWYMQVHSKLKYNLMEEHSAEREGEREREVDSRQRIYVRILNVEVNDGIQRQTDI